MKERKVSILRSIDELKQQHRLAVDNLRKSSKTDSKKGINNSLMHISSCLKLEAAIAEHKEKIEEADCEILERAEEISGILKGNKDNK